MQSSTIIIDEAKQVQVDEAKLEEIIARTITIGIDDCHIERAKKQYQRKQLKERILAYIATL